LEEIGRIAFSDPRCAFDQNGNLLDISDWPDDLAAAVSSLKLRENRRDDGTVTSVKEIKFWDKGRQLELACRHLGLFNDRVSVRVEGTLGARMAKIRKDAPDVAKMSPEQNLTI